MKNLLGALLLGAFALSAQAATVSIFNIVGTWSDAVPGAIITDSGTASPRARWGGDTGFGLSGYDFDAVSGIMVDVPPSPSATFSLGTFRHVNQPVQPPSITGIRLTLTADIEIDGALFGSRNFVFNFLHDETTNASDPCDFGGPNGQGVNINGCADRVRVASSFLTEDFLIGSEIYTLRIRGFEVGGVEVSEFLTAEQLINEAFIIGDVALRSQVIPEPSTFALALSALAGIVIIRRRKA